VSEQAKVEYIKAMIEWARDDARQVYLRVSGTLAIATLFVTQIPVPRLRELSYWPTLALFAGLGSLVVAALAYFIYVSKTHIARRTMALSLCNLDVKTPDTILTGIDADWGWLLVVGNVLFGAGVLLLAYVLWALVA
jgi:phosphatidylserine synthase